VKKFLLHFVLAVLFLALIPLGVVLFFSIFGNPLGVSNPDLIGKANEFAIYEAVKIQKYLNNQAKCPVELGVWDSPVTLDEYHFQKNISNSRESIPVWLSCEEGLKFDIWVRYSIDSDLSIVGGKGKELKILYGHFTDLKTLVIDESVENEELKNMLIREKLITNNSS